MRERSPLVAAIRSPVASLRAVAWAWSEARRLGEALRHEGMHAIDGIRPSPPVPGSHRPTVTVVLRRSGASCLVRSAVLQRWDADRDRVRPLVLGVAREAAGGVAAHAWLDGDLDGDGDDFVELHRRLPRQAPASVEGLALRARRPAWVSGAGRSVRSGRS